MKLSSFRITITAVIILAVLIPSIFISQYLYIALKKSIKIEVYNLTERIRDEKINQIKDFFSQEFHDIEKIITYMSFEDDEQLNKEMKYLLDFQPNIRQVVLYSYNFKPLVNVSRGGFLPLDSISDKIRITLQKNFYFSKYFLNNIVQDNSQSDLVFFYKDISSDKYLSITLEYNYLDRYLKETGNISIDLYNKNNQVIASSREEYDSRKVVNSSLTDKMELGLSENVLYKGFYNSYSHIDIGGESLYINVSTPKSSVDKKSDYISNNLIIIYFFYLLISLLLGTLLVRFFYTIKESEIRTEIFSNRFSFFYRLKDSLSYMDKKFIEIQRLSKAMNYFKNDISLILQDIPNKHDKSEEHDKETESDK